MAEETWREYPINSKYIVSSEGRVARVFKKEQTKWGYLRCNFLNNGKLTHFPIHRLVLETFIGECPPNREVNHRDGDKTNNSLHNLEWVTHSENLKHAYSIGLINQENRITAISKLTFNDICEIRKLYGSGEYTQRELGKKFSVHQAYISCIINKKRRVND